MQNSDDVGYRDVGKTFVCCAEKRGESDLSCGSVLKPDELEQRMAFSQTEQ